MMKQLLFPLWRRNWYLPYRRYANAVCPEVARKNLP